LIKEHICDGTLYIKFCNPQCQLFIVITFTPPTHVYIRTELRQSNTWRSRTHTILRVATISTTL